MKVLVIDVGGTHVKVLASGARSGAAVRLGADADAGRDGEAGEGAHRDWSYDAISIGYPGLVMHGRIAGEPTNLGRGWVGLRLPRRPSVSR